MFGGESKTMTNMPGGDLHPVAAEFYRRLEWDEEGVISESDVDSGELPGRDSGLLIRKDANAYGEYSGRYVHNDTATISVQGAYAHEEGDIDARGAHSDYARFLKRR